MTYQPRNPVRPILAAAAVAVSVAWLAAATLLPAAAGASSPAVALAAESPSSAVLDLDGRVRLASVRVTVF